MKKRADELPELRGLFLEEVSWEQEGERRMLTVAFVPLLIDTCTRDQNIVHNGENAFATNPVSISVLYSTIIQNSRFVELDASSMDGAGKGNLIRVEVLPT